MSLGKSVNGTYNLTDTISSFLSKIHFKQKMHIAHTEELLFANKEHFNSKYIILFLFFYVSLYIFAQLFAFVIHMYIKNLKHFTKEFPKH